MIHVIKQNKNILYGTGLPVILIVWLVLNIGVISVFSIINFVMLLSFGYIAMICDIKTGRIPNILVLFMMAGWLLLVSAALLMNINERLANLADSMFGLLIGGGMFLLVYLFSKKGLGGGDVKFMSAAGLYLGFSNTIPVILYGTILAALTGLTLMALKIIGRKDTMPLAPFLYAGILITLFTQ